MVSPNAVKNFDQKLIACVLQVASDHEACKEITSNWFQIDFKDDSQYQVHQTAKHTLSFTVFNNGDMVVAGPKDRMYLAGSDLYSLSMPIHPSLSGPIPGLSIGKMPDWAVMYDYRCFHENSSCVTSPNKISPDQRVAIDRFFNALHSNFPDGMDANCVEQGYGSSNSYISTFGLDYCRKAMEHYFNRPFAVFDHSVFSMVYRQTVEPVCPERFSDTMYATFDSRADAVTCVTHLNRMASSMDRSQREYFKVEPSVLGGFMVVKDSEGEPKAAANGLFEEIFKRIYGA